MEENDKIKEAAEKYDVILGDEELIRLAELKEKGEMDERNMKRVAREEGIAEGHKSGLREKQIEIAKKLIQMKFPIDKISEATGLSKEEIGKLN